MLRLRIERLAHGGEGVGTLPSGKTVFVAGTAPGDLIDAELFEERARSARARLVAVLQPGAARVATSCRHAAVCGGCPLQQVSQAAQEAAKEAAFYDALLRLGGVPREEIPGALPIVRSPGQLHYRSRCRLTVEGGATGYHGRRSHSLVRLEECPLLEEPLERLALAFVAAIAAGPVAGLSGLSLCVGADGAGSALLEVGAAHAKAAQRRAGELLESIPGLSGIVLQAPGVPPRLLGEPVVRRPAPAAPGVALLSRADVFTQANAAGSERLVGLVLEALAPAATEELLELHAGAGSFTFALTARAARVTAVEQAGPALELSRRAATEAGVKNLRLLAGDAATVCRGLAADGRRFPVALLDPPRAGAKELPAALAALGPERIAYVSCEPATLARDVRAFTALGYRVTGAAPVDMFPQTYHVEGFVLLTRRA